MNKIQKFALQFDKVIKSSNSFLLIPHINMDGDALGSLLACCLILKEKGKQIKVFTTDTVPSMYNFLPGVKYVTNTLPDSEFDCAILFECPSYSRSPAGNNFKAKITVNIDHHPDNDLYGDLNYVDTGASSVGEIFYDIFSCLEYPMNSEIATNLYVAIYTDTGGFNFSNTTNKTHLIISKMLDKFDLPLDEISRRVDREMAPGVFRLLGHLMENIRIHEGGVATSILTRDLLYRYGIDDADHPNFARHLFQIKGINTMALLKEKKDREIKVSLRSNLIPVNKVAATFSGGGHPKAAGCAIKNVFDIYEAERLVISALYKMLNSGERLQK
ncbi:MAG: bifunctional oligoribonuclease/PAP phosphatase NrnA [Candidatus Eremiobacteraeota bacterium]|nr:bifunctional oligoribonuclease/PAP phosphatase NrnA [Candidatus Eremiobacteraeota bacterium]